MGVWVTAIREEKEVKRIQIRKEVKLSLFADDMTLYIEDSKDATRKLLELNEFGKVAVYKINTQKSVDCYTTNERPKKEIQETIPFTIASRIRYSEINLLKETNCRW